MQNKSIIRVLLKNIQCLVKYFKTPLGAVLKIGVSACLIFTNVHQNW